MGSLGISGFTLTRGVVAFGMGRMTTQRGPGAQVAARKVSDAGRLGFGMVGPSALSYSMGSGGSPKLRGSSGGRGGSYFVGVGGDGGPD